MGNKSGRDVPGWQSAERRVPPGTLELCTSGMWSFSTGFFTRFRHPTAENSNLVLSTIVRLFHNKTKNLKKKNFKFSVNNVSVQLAKKLCRSSKNQNYRPRRAQTSRGAVEAHFDGPIALDRVELRAEPSRACFPQLGVLSTLAPWAGSASVFPA